MDRLRVGADALRGPTPGNGPGHRSAAGPYRPGERTPEGRGENPGSRDRPGGAAAMIGRPFLPVSGWYVEAWAVGPRFCFARQVRQGRRRAGSDDRGGERPDGR